MFTKDPILNSVAEAYKKMSKDMMDFHDEAYGKVYTVKKEDANEFITKAAAAKKAGQTSFKFGDKTYPVTIKIDPDKILEAEKAMKDASSKKAKVTVNPTDDDLRESDGESVVNERKVQSHYADPIGDVLYHTKSLKLKDLGKEFEKKGIKYDYNTKPFPHYIVHAARNKKVVVVNRRHEFELDKYGIKHDFYFTTVMESVVNESVVNEMNDMEMVADQLVNAVEDGIIGKDEFADFLSQETKFDKKSLGKVYDAYLDLDPRTRMKLSRTRDMMKFLKDRGLKEEVLTEGNVKLPSSAKKFWNTPPEKLIKTRGNLSYHSIPASQWNTHPTIIDEYGEDFGADLFEDFIRENLDSKGHLNPKLAKMIGLPTNTSIIDYLNDGGSGLNRNKNFKKYGNWFSALNDIYEEMEKRFGRVKAESVVNEDLLDEAKEPKIITQLRDVIENGYQTLKDPKTGKRMKVDSFSANAIVKVYDNLNPSNQEKFAKLGLLRMQKFAFDNVSIRR